MKTTRLGLILFLITAALLIAATLTVDIPTNDVPRVSEAFGNLPFVNVDGQTIVLGRNATINEVSYITRLWVLQRTKDWEKQKARAAYSPTPLEMQPTPTSTATATATSTATATATATSTATPTATETP